MEPLTLGIIAIVVIILLVIRFVLVPYLKNKGIVNEQNTKATSQLLNLISLVLSNINLGNDKIQSEADKILGITQKVVQYVEQTMKTVDNAGKKQAAIDATKDILGKLNIQVTPENSKLIEIGIESAVNVLPKTY